MYRQVHDGIIWLNCQKLLSFLIIEIVISCPVSLPNSSYAEEWIGELDIIMQMVNFTSSCKVLIYSTKKVQNKHGKQLNFMYHFALEHTRRLVRPASLSFARTRLNFWYQSKFRMTVIACVQFKVFEKFTRAYHMRNHVINYS